MQGVAETSKLELCGHIEVCNMVKSGMHSFLYGIKARAIKEQNVGDEKNREVVVHNIVQEVFTFYKK